MAIVVISILAAVFLTSYWRVILGLFAIASLTLIFVGVLTVLSNGQGLFNG